MKEGARDPRPTQPPDQDEESDEDDFNPERLLELGMPSHSVNWFKYLLDKYLNTQDDDGGTSALRTQDGYASLLGIVQSQKSGDEI